MIISAMHAGFGLILLTQNLEPGNKSQKIFKKFFKVKNLNLYWNKNSKP